MNPIDLTKLYEKQISLTEWLQNMNHDVTQAMRIEDNDKRERMGVLHSIIGLPFDKPTQFPARVVADRTPEFVAFLDARADELCALRLIPIDPDLPKLRMRGYTIRDSLKWFGEQGIDPDKYKADFVPHPSDHVWSTIFVVNEYGIFGEIIHGSHNQLTQGFHDEGTPIVFAYDFVKWQMSEDNPEAMAHVTQILEYIRVPDASQQERVRSALTATFARGYLCGYFETVTSNQFGIWFIDYNRILGQRYGDVVMQVSRDDAGADTSDVVARGQTGSRGCASGRVRIVRVDELAYAQIDEGDILVCDMTTPDYLPLMLRAGAIITDLGGILTHAAIIARELKKPCIVGTRNATDVLHDGDIVEVDADAGTVRICT